MPATLILILGGVTAVSSLLLLVMGSSAEYLEQVARHQGPGFDIAGFARGTTQNGLVWLGLSSFVIVGALAMRKLRYYALSVATALLTVALFLPFWFAGPVLGFWAFVVLVRPSVRDAFDAHARA